ncbi:MAG: glutathione peroxidase [Gammaproteobacteria bacterium]|nr:glutathione peroxidase [Gammaproteobacteria bacterium]
MLNDISGQSVPSVTFKTRQNDQWLDVTTEQLFANKTVVVFSLPGAFTPTCSATHLPRYNELAGVLKENGVDEIVCMSVNDTFVMNAWLADQDASNITVIPDGNGEFTQGMGMLVDKQEIGFGKRSWRYSMLVKNGVIDKMFIEAQNPGDPFLVSDADTMLNYINSEAQAPVDISLFTKPSCPHCARAKQLLRDKKLGFEEVVIGQDATLLSLRAMSGRSTVPQVFIGGKHIGGADDLEQHFS